MKRQKLWKNAVLRVISMALTICMILTMSEALIVSAVEAVQSVNTTEFALSSPNGALKITLSNSSGSLLYTVKRNDSTVIEASKIGIKTNECDFSSGLSYVSQSDVTLINETYQKYSGNYSTGHNYCNERSVTFEKGDYRYTVTMRAYNDGIAFRSAIALKSGVGGTVTVTDEVSGFVFPSGTTVKAQEIPASNMNGSDSTYSYETASYTTYNIANTTGEYLAFATLCQVGNTYVLLNEADLYGDSFYGSCVYGVGNNTLELHPAPAVFGNPQAVTMDPEFTTPWRYAIIGDLETLVESDLTENLNPAPAAGSDFSWVEPGVTAWLWMTEGFSGQRNEATLKKYIDLAAEMGWKYIILDEGWQPNSTVSGKVYDGYFDYFDDMIAYADSLGVGFVVWVKHVDLDTAAEREVLSEWADKGIKGIKADFFDSETVDKIDCLEAIYNKCAEEKLLVNIHGGNKPTGERRTWPNVINRESIHGQEWNEMLSANTTIWSYTRGIIGPSDVTPYIYPAKIGSSGSGNFTTTTAHQLALNVIVESGMPCMASSAEEYLSCNMISFFKNLPAKWDSIEFLLGDVQDYTVLARQSGSCWFVAGVTQQARNVSFNLEFLTPGKNYVATIFADNTKTEVQISNQTVTATDWLSLSMITGGGFVVMLREADTTILPESISFASDIVYLESGKTAVLNTSPENADVSDMLITTTVDGIVSINKTTGVITAHNPGITTVTVTCPITGATATAEFRVYAPIGEDGLAVYDLPHGKHTTVLASKILKDAQASALEYASADPQIASVDGNGKVTANAIGVTTIIAKNPTTGEIELITVRVFAAKEDVASTRWEIVNATSTPPALSATTPYTAKIPIDKGDLYASLPLQNLLLIDAPTGNFTLTVKVEGGLSANYESIGLVAFESTSNMVVMERRYHSYLGGNIFGLSTYTTKHNEYTAADTASTADAYLKMEKAGNVFTGYYSYDGITWTKISTTITSEVVATAENLKIGLVARAGSANPDKVAVYHNFTLNGRKIPFVDTANNSIWEVINPAANSRPIVSESNPNKVQMTIPTGDIYSGRPPQNVLAIDAPSGDFEITVKVSGGLNANYESIGLVAYHNNSNMVTVERRYHSGLGGNLFGLSTHNGSYTELKVSDSQKTADAYLKMTKVGNVFNGYYSYDGITWTQITGSITSATVANSSDLKIGLIARSGSGVSANTATYQDFTLNGEKLNFIETHKETNWEITNPTGEGVLHAAQDANRVEVQIPTGNIDGGSNTLKNLFLLDAPAGDFELTVKVSGGLNANYESIGLIAFASMGSVVTVERRYHPGLGGNIFGLANYNKAWNEPKVSDSRTTTGAYLKMVKSGDVFTGYYRYEDAADWTLISSITAGGVANTTDLKIGLVARAGNTVSKNVAKFEDFTLNGEAVPFYYSRTVQLIKPAPHNVTLGSDLALPTTVKAYTATGQIREVSVVWDTASLDAQTTGEYVLTGSADGLTTTLALHILPATPADPPANAPVIKGFQKSLDGSSVRFAAIVDSLEYEAIGFTYNVFYNGVSLMDEVQRAESTTVYRAISANIYGISQSITAENLGGAYIYAVTFTNVFTEGNISFEITAFATSEDGSTQYNGTTYRVSFEDGVYVGWQTVA